MFVSVKWTHRKILDQIAQVQGESGYPYIMYANNVNDIQSVKGQY